MNRIFNITVLSLVLGVAGTATAQDPHVVYDRELGELSVGAHAPTRANMVDVIRSGAPTAIMSLLEHGERVECHECVPLLERRLLEDSDARVREFAAWWLRRRPFAIGVIMRNMRVTLESDADPVRRSRAAEAIGEFLDPTGLEVLRNAVTDDDAAIVRTSAVLALGRLNHPAGNVTIAGALSDSEVTVRRAAVDVVLRVNFFREYDALVGSLADTDVEVRRRAALLTGEFRLDAAVPALAGMLRGDADRNVRQAAAWALGRIGGSQARTALTEGMEDTDSLVRDAVGVALRMR